MKNFTNLLGGALANKKTDELTIRKRIIIREDFKALIPPLSKDEIQQLEDNILKEGVRDPLIIWQSGDSFVLVDGHNRFSICKKHGLDFPFKKAEFKDDDEARDWMIKNQLGRRNLSQEQQSYLRGMRYNREKSQGKRTDLTLDHNDPKSTLSTAAQLAQEYKVGEATIKRDGEFAKALEKIGNENPTLKEDIMKGKSKLSKKEIRSKANNPLMENSVNRVQKITRDELAQIAYDYIKVEKRSLDEIQSLIGNGANTLTPIQYFLKWKELKNNE